MIRVAATVAILLIWAPGLALAGASRLPGDVRPIAIEASARAAWVNPAGVTSDGRASLMIETAWIERDDSFEFTDPDALSLGFAFREIAWAYRTELNEDVPGVPDWTLIAARRVVRPNGFAWGSTVEWRGGDDSGLDGTVGVLVPLTRSVRGALVVEDVFARKVDGVDGERVWRTGASFAIAKWGSLAWDWNRPGQDDDRHWFSLSTGRGGLWSALFAVDEDGEWSGRIGIGVGSAQPSFGLRDAGDGAPRLAFAAFEAEATPQIVR